MNGMYDGSTVQYTDYLQSSVGRQLELCSVLHVAGDMMGKDVVDLGCGTGWYGRQLLSRGARSALGVDSSPDMLAEARHLSTAAGDAMTFEQQDLRDLQLELRFDTAIASWVFCHATSIEALASMYSAVASVLRPGGQLVAVVNNPAYRLEDGDYAAYGAKAIAQQSYPDANRLTFEFAGDPPMRVVDHQWGTVAHQQAAYAAGFGRVAWERPGPSALDVETSPSGFWDEFQRNPVGVILHCRR